MDSKSTRVTLLGLDPRSEQVVAMAFEQRANGRCELGSEADAEVVIMDFDNAGISEVYSALRQRRPQIPVIAVSTHAPDTQGLAHLPKPVSVARLFELIEELAGKPKEGAKMNGLNPEKIEQARRAIDAKRAAASLEGRAGKARDQRSDLKRGLAAVADEMYFDPDRFLLGHVQRAFAQACEASRPVVLTCLREETIGFDPRSAMVVTSLSDTQIRSLAIAPTDDELALPIEARVLDGELGALPQRARRRFFSAETFLWNLGYLTSRGRLPYGTQGGERVYLRRWPNLTRSVVPPNAMRILAYWIGQPCELLSLHEILSVPMEDVFAVYSAACAAGLSGAAKRQADALMESFDIPVNRQRGLFANILNRLGKRAAPGSEVA